MSTTTLTPFSTLLNVGLLVAMWFPGMPAGTRGVLAQDDEKTQAIEYVAQAEKAFRESRLAEAEELYRKAIGLSPENRKFKYFRGIVLDQMGRRNDALAVMQALAPLDADETTPGFLYAHYWIARSVLSKRVEVESPVPLAERHLRAVLRQDPKHVGSHRILANLAIKARNGKVAIEHLSRIVDDEQELRMVYAQLLDRAGRKAEAKKEAARAFDYYEETIGKQLAASPKRVPKTEAWLRWALAAALQERFTDALAILDRADRYCDDKKPIRHGLAEVYVRWSQHLDEDIGSEMQQQLQLLGRALRAAPDSVRVLQRVALLSNRKAELHPTFEKTLHDALAGTLAAGVAQTLLVIRKDSGEDAIEHFRKSMKVNPNFPIALNNLAWVFVRRIGAGNEEKEVGNREADLETALSLANYAVELEPNQSNFRDTRGQIRIKLGHWEDGVADLRIALSKQEANAEIHKSLALGYSKLGNTKLSSKHRRRYEELTASTKKALLQGSAP